MHKYGTYHTFSENQVVDGVKSEQNISKDKTKKLEKDLGSDKASSEENTVHQQVSVLDGEQNGDKDNKSSKDKSSDDSKVNVNEAEKGQAGTRDRRRQQNQGRWRGVDPVIFFKDEVTVKSIVSFYGITDSFPLEGHLVTRNPDASHVKRIYYVSKSVQDVLELNIKVGERLKITSLGLKIFVGVQLTSVLYQPKLLSESDIFYLTRLFSNTITLSFRKGSLQRKARRAHLGCHQRDCHSCFHTSQNRFYMHLQLTSSIFYSTGLLSFLILWMQNLVRKLQLCFQVAVS